MTPSRVTLVLAVLLCVAAPLSLMAGHVWIAPADWLGGDLRAVVIMQLRLPRLVAGILVGGALGMSGAAMQGYLRNPLADPGLFGISSCAALGAVLSLWLGLGINGWILPVFALGGAALGMALLSIMAGQSGSLLGFTLAGIALSSLAGAFTSLLISLAPTPFASAEIVTWLMGALVDRSWNDVLLAGPLLVAGMALLIGAGRSLDLLSIGELTARSLGLNMRALQLLILAGVGLTVGPAVAIAGIIGFVGLVVPHLLRPVVGGLPSALLVPSALGGALLVVVADCVVRILPSASEVRLGIVMAVLGGPFFLLVLNRLRREAT